MAIEPVASGEVVRTSGASAPFLTPTMRALAEAMLNALDALDALAPATPLPPVS